MEGRRAHAVAHLAYARSQKSGTGILGSKRVLQGGEKSSPLSVLRDLWLVYGVYGLGGEKWKCGPWERKRGSGQTLVAGNVVQGAKLRPRVKRCPARVWSRERNYGLGSSTGGGKCGPWGETAGLGQTLVAGNVVRGEKLRLWVKRWWREVWSREKNYGLGSNAGGGKCGPGRETAALGQTRPRRSVVQGAKLRPRVKLCPARVWSREPNRAPGSPPAPPKHGLGSKTVPPGQARPAAAWSREQNRALGQARVPRSPPAPSPRPRT